MRMPKRGFNSRNRLDLAEVNLWRLAKALEAKKLDAKKAIGPAELVAAGVIRRAKDGVRLLGKGEIKAKLDLTVYSASAGAVKAIEAAGGSVTQTRPAPVAEEAQA
jgi:large subunit ribosomal protein L15